MTTTYVYDTFNRVQSVSYSDGTPTVTHYYDGQGLVSTPVNALGKRTAVVNSVSTSRWPEFDAMGRSVKSSQVTGGITCTLTYTYNLAGSLKSVTYPSGKTVTSSFDRLNRVTGLQRAGYSYAQAIKYEPHGAVRSTQLGNGLWEQSRYNDRQQLKQRGVGTSDTSAVEVLNASHCGTLLLDFDYGTTNNNGNLRTGKITIGSHVFQQSYTYDGINRLKTASESKAGVATWSQTYQYDQWGNRWVIAGADCAPYSDLVPLTPVSSGDYASPVTNRLRSGSGYYTYDAAGNITVDKNQWTYAYDAENRLKSYSCGSNCGARRADAGYAYDGEGRRVRTVSGSTTTLFFYDASGRLAAEYLNGTLAKEYIYLGDRLLAFDPAGGTTTYLTQDHLGSTRLLTGAGPTVISRHDYLPFGDEVDGSRYRAGISGYTIPASPGPSRQKFTGKERDNESGLDYFGARYYSGPQGRFTSVDPYNPIVDSEDEEQFQAYLSQPQNWNRYTYAWNNPLKYYDPTGEAVELIGATDEERRKALEAIKQGVGSEAGGKLYINEVTEGGKTRYFVGIQGDVGQFMKLSDSAHDLANIVLHPSVVEFALTDRNLAQPGMDLGGAGTFKIGEDAGQNQNVRVLLNPEQIFSVADRRLRLTIGGAAKFERGAIRPLTIGIATQHEFGHAWGHIHGRLDWRSNSEAVAWENNARALRYGPLGPRNARRRRD